MADLQNETDINSNVWWQVTEARVDDYNKTEFASMLQMINDDLDLRVFGAEGQDYYWQFQPVDDEPGRYAIRCSRTALEKQLGVCYEPDEKIADRRTRACMQDSNGGDEQKWNIANWGNDTYRLYNIKNGSNYYLDVIPGSALFLNPDISTETYQPAQRWLWTSVKNINDGAYSTVFTDDPATSTGEVTTTTDSAATTTGSSSGSGSTSSSGSSGNSSSNDDDSSSGGLSTGAAAGVGVGVALGVIFLAVAAFLLWRRRRQARGAAVSQHELPVDQPPPPSQSPPTAAAGYANYSYSPATPSTGLQEKPPSPAPAPVYELSQDSHAVELPAGR